MLFQVYFLALLLEERGAGSLAEVAEAMSEKLIRRHPHVFGETEAETAGEVLRNWDRIKREEEGRGADDPFADVPENLPACSTPARCSAGPPRPGSTGDGAAEERLGDDQTREAAERWIGETCSSSCDWPAACGVDPELALRAAAHRFRDRALGD